MRKVTCLFPELLTARYRTAILFFKSSPTLQNLPILAMGKFSFPSFQYRGFIAFDKLKCYDNATWTQLTCYINVISGRLSDVSAVKIQIYPFLCLQD